MLKNKLLLFHIRISSRLQFRMVQKSIISSQLATLQTTTVHSSSTSPHQDVTRTLLLLIHTFLGSDLHSSTLLLQRPVHTEGGSQEGRWGEKERKRGRRQRGRGKRGRSRREKGRCTQGLFVTWPNLKTERQGCGGGRGVVFHSSLLSQRRNKRATQSRRRCLETVHREMKGA